MDEQIELSVSEARDNFSDAVNRATFAGEITWITRGRGRARAAAIVPASLIEAYEAMVDREDVRYADERLRLIRSGKSKTVPADEVWREHGL